MEQNMAKINETIIEGRKFRRLIDKRTNTWERISGWIVTDRPFKRGIPINDKTIHLVKLSSNTSPCNINKSYLGLL